MTLTKTQAFFAMLATVAGLCLLYQSLWIFSTTTTADIYQVRKLTRRTNAGMKMIDATYMVDYKTYDESFFDAGFVSKLDKEHPRLEIRYLDFAPGIARANIFLNNWGPSLLFFGIALFIATVVFLRKDIVADTAIFVLQPRAPFVKIQHNEIGEYDEQVIDKHPAPSEESAIEQIKQTLATLPAIAETADYQISASVYKLNPNAIGVFVAYLFFIIWCLSAFSFLIHGLERSLAVGFVLLFVPLYIQNTSNKTFKAKILDDSTLAFATNGILYKELLYPVEAIEAAAVYLESFGGFKYRDRTSMGNAVAVSDGDNNKISFRYNGEIQDLTFYLADYKDYFALKNLFALWSSRGTNIILQKVFEDDFIVQEIAHFSAA